MGGNGNYFSGINGNGIKVPKTAVGMGMKSWEWEGMVCKNLFRTSLLVSTSVAAADQMVLITYHRI